ncbi:hypothetical protein ABZ845_04240 [Streptomyces sp. NPDC047022]|uniref:hypothetical protein n=1 Tax=Streptomyces sp. NPDC047022 TaxID=3155737 RepID=UPI0034001ED9
MTASRTGCRSAPHPGARSTRKRHGRYRQWLLEWSPRPYPARILGLTIRYLNPVTGEYATPQLALETQWDDKWTDAASEDIGL